MGERMSFLAVRGRDMASLLQAFDLEVTGVSDAEPLSFRLGCAETPQGWLVIRSPDYAMARKRTHEASRGGEAIGFGIETHVMATYVLGCRDGREAYWIGYNDPPPGDGFNTRGALPDSYLEILRAAEARQAAEDLAPGGPEVDAMIEVAADLVMELTGYRYDMNDPPPFQLLRKVGGLTRFARRLRGG